MQQNIAGRWPDANSNPSQNIVVFKNGERTQKPDSNVRFVGTPTMNSICKHLATDLNVVISTRVEKVEPLENGIRLSDESRQSIGEFDRLIVSAPAAQTAELLVNFPVIANPISKIQMQPCWAAMISFAHPIADDWVGGFIHDSILTWAARNSTKPQRPSDAEHLLLHAGHEWTADNWERDADEAAAEMLQAFWKSSGIEPQQSTHLQAHRWKYAIPVAPPETRCFFDAASGIAACGDWAGGPRVEGAFLSGMAAAGRILGTLSPLSDNAKSQQQLF
jgi:predicted NAD/FAD-dependent oxidoreductase